MKFLPTLCFLCAVIYGCYGGCWIMPPESQRTGINSVYRPCFYGGQLIPYGSSVTRNCLSCFCGEHGLLKCCSVGTKISQYPDDCKKIVSEDGCYEHAVKVSDERSICTHGVGMVGR